MPLLLEKENVEQILENIRMKAVQALMSLVGFRGKLVYG